MAGVTIHESLVYSKKIEHLMRECALNRKEALGAMTLLWLWVSRNAPDGILPMLRDAEIASIALVECNPHSFVSALIEVRLVDKTQEGLKVHDWNEWAPDHVVKKIVRQTADKRRTNGGHLSSSPQEDLSPLVVLFPTSGEPKDWPLRESYVTTLKDLYMGIDVVLEAKKALNWIESNPTRKKTAKGMRRFLAGWMERSQNRGPGRFTKKTSAEKDAEFNAEMEARKDKDNQADKIVENYLAK